jgi:hypothetical protein
VHEWKAFNNDDAPTKDGIAAGLYDVDNMAYVGKGDVGTIIGARIQVSEPENGAYLMKSGKSYRQKNGAFYLVDNPNYHYYWVDSRAGTAHPNAIVVKTAESSTVSSYIGRLQVDGKTNVGRASAVIGMVFVGSNGMAQVGKSYQVLVCDPKPVNPCSKFIINFSFKT